MEENRLVSIRANNVGSKKDRGVIVFLEGSASYLIFPKALPMAEGAAVIGLKFEELEDAPVIKTILTTLPELQFLRYL